MAYAYEAGNKYEGTVLCGFLGRTKNTNEPLIIITVEGEHGELDWEKVVTGPSGQSKGTAEFILKTLHDIWGVTREQLATEGWAEKFVSEGIKGKRVSFVPGWTQASESAPRELKIDFLNPIQFRRAADPATMQRFTSVFAGTAAPPAKQSPQQQDPWGDNPTDDDFARSQRR